MATSAGVVRTTFRAFTYPNFRLLWTGAFTSSTGTWLQEVAQSWLVYDLTGSTVKLGLTAFLAGAPILLFSLIGGVVADRMDRRKLLLLSQYTQMASAFLLALLLYSGKAQVEHIMVLAFVNGLAQAFARQPVLLGNAHGHSFGHLKGEAEQVGGDDDGRRVGVVLEGQGLGVDVLQYSLRGLGPGAVAGQPDRFLRRDVNPGRAGPPSAGGESRCEQGRK